MQLNREEVCNNRNDAHYSKTDLVIIDPRCTPLRSKYTASPHAAHQQEEKTLAATRESQPHNQSLCFVLYQLNEIRPLQ